MKKTTPLVWLPFDHRQLGSGSQTMPALVLGDKYARAVKVNAHAQPVLFALADGSDVEGLLELVDGVMLTGSPSNINPAHFGESVADPALPLDETRDALTLALVRGCIRRAIPLLGICRGFQEINVALGGSLHQQVHAVDGMLDHREPKDQPYADQYAPRHAVRIAPGSQLASMAGGLVAQVNSLHGQGINRLAQGLRPVAFAPDGLVEAFEVENAGAFALAVQWHPEWQTSQNPFYNAIFKAFGEACQAHGAARHATATMAEAASTIT